MAARPKLTITDTSYLGSLQAMADGFSEQEIAKEVKHAVVPITHRYHPVADRAHPLVLRACALMTVLARESRRLEAAHDDMHEKMRRAHSEVSTPEHYKVHTDMSLAKAGIQIAGTSFYMEIFARHPEFSELDHQPRLGEDGSIGWLEERFPAGLSVFSLDERDLDPAMSLLVALLSRN